MNEEDYKYIRQSLKELFAEVDKLKEKVTNLEQHSNDYTHYLNY